MQENTGVKAVEFGISLSKPMSNVLYFADYIPKLNAEGMGHGRLSILEVYS